MTPNLALNDPAFVGAASGGGVTYVIPSIGNEYWHYDFAGEQSVITSVANRVSKVTDGFGTTSRDLLQGTADRQPLFIANDTNGLGVCQFEGDRYMQTGDIGTLSQPFTVFSVQQFLTGGAGNQEGLTVDGRALANRLNHCNHYAVDNVMLNCGANLPNDGNATDNENHLVVSRVNGTSSHNIVDTIDCATCPADAGSSNWEGVTIGANSVHLSVFWNAKIMEVACYNADVSGSDLTDVSSYFMDRWGIS